MPMYYDFTGTRRKRWLAPMHKELACEFLEALRRRQYSERSHEGTIDELAEDDLTDSVIATWALLRRKLIEPSVHLQFKHRDDWMADHGDGEHGHMMPPLFVLAQKLPAKYDGDQAEFDRAHRDLLGLVGLKVSAARGKFEPEEVFDERRGS